MLRYAPDLLIVRRYDDAAKQPAVTGGHNGICQKRMTKKARDVLAGQALRPAARRNYASQSLHHAKVFQSNMHTSRRKLEWASVERGGPHFTSKMEEFLLHERGD